MDKSRLFAFVAIVFLILGFALGRLGPANGRYQLASFRGEGKDSHYRLDTRTGKLATITGGRWVDWSGKAAGSP